MVRIILFILFFALQSFAVVGSDSVWCRTLHFTGGMTHGTLNDTILVGCKGTVFYRTIAEILAGAGGLDSVRAAGKSDTTGGALRLGGKTKTYFDTVGNGSLAASLGAKRDTSAHDTTGHGAKVGGSGTAGYLPYWLTAGTQGNSPIYTDGSGNIAINSTYTTGAQTYLLSAYTTKPNLYVYNQASGGTVLQLDFPNAYGNNWLKFTTSNGAYTYGALTIGGYALEFTSQFNLQFMPGAQGGDPTTAGVTIGYNDLTATPAQRLGINTTSGGTQRGLRVLVPSGNADVAILDKPNGTTGSWLKFTATGEQYTYGAITAGAYALKYTSQFNLQLAPGEQGGDPTISGVTVGYNEYKNPGATDYKLGIIAGNVAQGGLNVLGRSGQTANLQNWGIYASGDGVSGGIYYSTLASVSAAGKGTFSAVQDAALATAGIVTNDASGNLGTSTFASLLTSAGGLSGAGTAGYMPKFTAGTTLSNSLIRDDGAKISIGAAPFVYALLTIGAGDGSIAGICIESGNNSNGTNTLLNISGSLYWQSLALAYVGDAMYGNSIPKMGGTYGGGLTTVFVASSISDSGSLVTITNPLRLSYDGTHYTSLTVNASGNLGISSNVGIGQPDPTYPLDIVQTSSPGIHLYRPSVNSSIRIGGSSSGALALSLSADHDIIFNPGNTQAMVITGSGMVGIINNSPAYTLDFACDFTYGVINSASIRLGNATWYDVVNGGDLYYRFATNSDSASGARFDFITGYRDSLSSQAERTSLSLWKDKVGIGYTAPLSALCVNGGINIGSAAAAGSNTLRISYNDTHYGTFVAMSSGNIAISTYNDAGKIYAGSSILFGKAIITNSTAGDFSNGGNISFDCTSYNTLEWVTTSPSSDLVVTITGTPVEGMIIFIHSFNQNDCVKIIIGGNWIMGCYGYTQRSAILKYANSVWCMVSNYLGAA
jgi:hypothetical protein